MADSRNNLLTFISTESSSEAAQEAIRVHVLRHRHRQRRESHRKRGNSRPAFAQHGGQFQVWQPDMAAQRSGRSPELVSSEFPHPYVDLDLYSQDEGIECNSPSKASPCEELESVAEEWSGLDRRSIEEILIEHCKLYRLTNWASLQADIFFRDLLSGGSPVAYDFLRAFRQSTATFSAFLAMMAARLSTEQGQVPLLDTVELEHQALQEVSRQISCSPTGPAHSTILTVALLANLREGQDLVCHWKGLLEMVRLYGGLCGLRTHRDLYAFLFWAESVTIDRCPESLGHLAPSPVEEGDPQCSMHELREFFGKINNHLSGQVFDGGTPNSKLTSPVLFSLQHPPLKKARYVCDKWRRARLSCLVYFAALSLDRECRLQDHPQYRAVETEVLSRERCYKVYSEELYYITVLVGNQDHICELTWSVARIVNALKEMDQRDWNTCYRLLALYLGFQDPHVTAMVSTELEELFGRLQSRSSDSTNQHQELPNLGVSQGSLGRK